MRGDKQSDPLMCRRVRASALTSSTKCVRWTGPWPSHRNRETRYEPARIPLGLANGLDVIEEYLYFYGPIALESGDFVITLSG